MTAGRRRAEERGFALVAVLLVLALVTVIGAEFAYSMRLEASSARAFKNGVIGAHLAEAGIEQAIRELVAPNAAIAAIGEDGFVTFFGPDGRPLPRLPRTRVPLGAGEFTYRLTDEEARINLNTSPPPRIDQLLIALELDKSQRDTIGDSLQDWRDADEDHRVNGAESEDTYLQLAVPYRSKNGNLDSLNELLQIKGVTKDLFYGVDGKPGLREYVTVKTPGQVNLNSAGEVVLKALGLSDAEISDIGQARHDAAYTSVPGRFAGRNLVTTSRTFRIEADGLVDGQVRATIMAIVQKRSDAGGATVAVLEWSRLR